MNFTIKVGHTLDVARKWLHVMSHAASLGELEIIRDSGVPFKAPKQGHPETTETWLLFFLGGGSKGTLWVRFSSRQPPTREPPTWWLAPSVMFGVIDCHSPKLTLPPTNLGVDSPFFSAVVLFENRSPFPQGFGSFLKRRMPGKNGEEVTAPTNMRHLWDEEDQSPQTGWSGAVLVGRVTFS